MDFLIVLVEKIKLEEKYALEAFVLFLDFFTYQDIFNEVKVHSMNFLERFLFLMQGSVKNNYTKELFNPFKKTEPVLEENLDEETKITPKNIKEEITNQKSSAKKLPEVEEFKDTGNIELDLIERLS